MITNYNQARDMLTGRCKESRKIANNTYLQRRDGDSIAVKLHNTDVITFYPDRYELNTGGWQTVTTKARINEFSPARLHQAKGDWFVNDCDYCDGIAFTYDNELINGAMDKSEKENRDELKKQIAKYAKLCSEALPLPVPNHGDCLICQLERSNPDKTGADNSHILSHFEEGYIVPSLVFNALKFSGQTDFVISFCFNHPDFSGSVPTWCNDTVKRAVTKFLKSRFQIAR